MPRIRLATLVRTLRREQPPDLGGSADADLLAHFAAHRDEAAFELLVWRHGGMVLASCRRVLGHTEDAEDAFQATFLVLARHAASVRQSVPAWLHRVAVRIAGKVVRKRRPTSSLEVEPAARPLPDPTERGELRGVLDAEIDRLSEPFRRAFVLCYLEGLSNADAARLLGCPVGTVESRLTAARRKLRDRLARRNVELPAGALALLGVQSGLAKESVANMARAGVVLVERGLKATIGIVGEPAAALARGELVMAKLRTWAGATLGLAMLGLAAGVGWANRPADPPRDPDPEVASAEPQVAPMPKVKDGKPGDAWPLAKQWGNYGGPMLHVSHDGKSIVFFGSGDKSVYGVPLSGQRGTSFHVRADSPMQGVALSPDGKTAVSAEGVNGVKVRDVATGKLLDGLWPTGDMPAEQVGFSADGSKFVVLCSRVEQSAGGPFGGLPRTKGAAGDRGKSGTTLEMLSKMTADEKSKVFGSGGGPPAKKASRAVRVLVFDAATRKELSHHEEVLTGNSVGFGNVNLAGHGRFLLTAEVISKKAEDGESMEARRFTITDPAAKKPKGVVEVIDGGFGMFGPDPLSPDGNTMVVWNGTVRSELRFIDTQTGKERFRAAPFRRPVKCVAFSPDGRFAAAATGTTSSLGGSRGDGIAAPSEVVIWDVKSGKELARLVDPDCIRNHHALAFSPDGSFLVSHSNPAFSGLGTSQGELTAWGTLPTADPEPVAEPAPKPVTKVPADVPDRFQALFASLTEVADDARRVEALFLAALGRLPSDVESRTLVSQLAKRNDKAEAMKDLLGTLVETAEFKAHAEALGRLAK